MIRDVKREDAGKLLEIYAPYVEKTAISFELNVPSKKEMEDRIESIIKKYPYIVYEKDGKILGYAYATAFKDRSAYDYSVETSIYVSKNNIRQGIGEALYEELEARLKSIGILNLYACIAYTETEDEYLTNDSMKFHESMGYVTVGTFHQCGYKFGKWYDMIWMEKMLGNHSDNPLEVGKLNFADEAKRYPAFVLKTDNDYVVEVVDFGISTRDQIKDVAIKKAKELMECVIESFVEEGIELPVASELESDSAHKGAEICYI